MAEERSKIDEKYKWNLSEIYESDEAFEADFAKAREMIGKYPEWEGKMCESGESLCRALTELVTLEGVIEKLWDFAFLSYSVNTADNPSQAKMARVRSLSSEADSASWFVRPKLIELDEGRIKELFSECEGLSSFKRIIELAEARKPHTLDGEGERLLARLGDCLGTHSDIRSIFSNSELHFGKISGEGGERVELSEANYIDMLMSGERRVRRAAFKRLYKVYADFKNTFATTFNAYIKEKCTLAAVRNYENAITASTARDEVTPTIYENLITSVNESLDALYEYYELKRERLGLSKMHLYDVYASMAPDSQTKYTYDRAVELVLDTVRVFGEEYRSVMERGLLCERWVDVYPTRAKRGGAFSAGSAYTKPYILMNYTDSYNEVSTLAHEGGHSMHSYFSRRYNEPHNSSYTIFVAEVASTVNELLLAHKMLSECGSKNEKLYILDRIMDTYRATLYRQTMFAEFEKEVYSLVEGGTPLTADTLSEVYYGLVKKYFGPRVVCDGEIQYEWARIPHFYMNFYVYKYATCISAASAIVKRIESEGEEYVKKYIDFLKCGGSMSPLDSLKVCEIDMTDPRVVSAAVEDFRAAISEFRRVSEED
ncbi:MAG: oligoendopeptidase F [Clostridia bacterium]|nr:oligoendopeptidase F [Clostridia bacterium]